MAITFNKPPLSEVALGYTFLHRPDLLIPHIGSFWIELEDVYPSCRHAQPVIEKSEISALSDLPLPRVWFTSADSARIVQVQQDRLLFNWRDSSSGATTGQPYVRYPAVKAEFDRVDALFRAHVLKHTSIPIQPASFSLTYVNLIRKGEGWSSPGDISGVFPDFVWKGGERFLPSPSVLTWRMDFPLPSGFGTLSTNVQLVKMTMDGEPILKFELVANSGSLGGKSIEFNEWSNLAHDWIIRAFKDLTSSKMHEKVWLLEKEA